jgi:hypothetical protein
MPPTAAASAPPNASFLERGAPSTRASGRVAASHTPAAISATNHRSLSSNADAMLDATSHAWVAFAVPMSGTIEPKKRQ